MNTANHYSHVAGLVGALLLTSCATPQRETPVSVPPVRHDFRSLARHGLSSNSAFHAVIQHSLDRLRHGAAEPEANLLAIINDGYEALMLRLHLIRNAKSSIDIQTFIWTRDEAGEAVMRELVAAARRGVRVRVIADHFGAAKSAEVAAYLTTVDPNLQIGVYRPKAASALRSGPIKGTVNTAMDFKGANQRMHNKTLIADGVAGITGGRNYENTYFNQSTRMNFKDRDALVIGPAATQMLNSFERFWSSGHVVAGRDLRDVAKAIRNLDAAKLRNSDEIEGRIKRIIRDADRFAITCTSVAERMRAAAHVEYFADLPGKNDAPLFSGSGRHTKQLRSILSEAETEIIIQSPYLILSPRGVKFFRAIRRARPGIGIIVSTNSFGSTDNVIAYSANVRQRELFVNNLGFRIHEYKPHPEDLLRVLPQYQELQDRSADEEPFLCIHAKSGVVDEAIAYIGTFNVDPRSANLNTEGGLLVRDPVIAKSIKADIMRDIVPGNSWVMAPARRAPNAAASEIADVGRLVAELLPLDIVPPLNPVEGFELLPGGEPVAVEEPGFYRNYRSVGRWPDDEDALTEKKVITRLLQTLAKSATPLL